MQFSSSGAVEWALPILPPENSYEVSGFHIHLGPDGIWVSVCATHANGIEANLVHISEEHTEIARLRFTSTDQVFVNEVRWDASARPILSLWATGNVTIPHVERTIPTGSNGGGILVAFEAHFASVRWTTALEGALGFPGLLIQDDGSVIGVTAASGRAQLRFGPFRSAATAGLFAKIVAVRISDAGHPMWMTSVAAPERFQDVLGAWPTTKGDVFVAWSTGNLLSEPPRAPRSLRLSPSNGALNVLDDTLQPGRPSTRVFDDALAIVERPEPTEGQAPTTPHPLVIHRVDPRNVDVDHGPLDSVVTRAMFGAHADVFPLLDLSDASASRFLVAATDDRNNRMLGLRLAILTTTQPSQ